MKITFKKGWEEDLQKRVMNSPEWKQQEIAINAEINKIRGTMAGHPASEVRSTLVRELPFLTDEKNAPLLAQLVTEISA